MCSKKKYKKKLNKNVSFIKKRNSDWVEAVLYQKKRRRRGRRRGGEKKKKKY